MRAQVKEQQALRMKGKLALGGAGSGSGRFNAKFMRTLSLQPSGASGATWQVCPTLAGAPSPAQAQAVAHPHIRGDIDTSMADLSRAHGLISNVDTSLANLSRAHGLLAYIHE